MQDWTEFPEFKEPSTSFRYEQLTEDEKLHFYKKQHMEKLTKKQVLRISGIGFLSFMALVLLSGLLVRFIVAVFMWGYNGFGVW